MIEYLTKRAEEARPFWLRWELGPGERVVDDLGWMIVPQETCGAGLEAGEAATLGAFSSVVLKGGRDGHLYHVSNRVRTSGGRVLSRALMLRVVAA